MQAPSNSVRRSLIAVVGDAGAEDSDLSYRLALELGQWLVDAGYRICNGGLSGVMRASFVGARQSQNYREGDTLAIIPTLNRDHANPYADIVLATGMGHLRNGLVAAADAMVVVGGKAGTLSEMSLAWRYNRLIIALSQSGGVAADFAGKALDQRKHRSWHPALETIVDAATVQEAIACLDENLPGCYEPAKDWGG